MLCQLLEDNNKYMYMFDYGKFKQNLCWLHFTFKNHIFNPSQLHNCTKLSSNTH